MTQAAADLHHSKPADLSRRFEETWNAHDMKAFGELFHEDATFTSRFGHFWRGRDEIVARHKVIHETIYRDCTIANRIEEVEDIDRHVAIVHVRSLVNVGRFMEKGPREFGTRFTCVAVRRAHHDWLIQSGTNVALADPETGEQVIDLQSLPAAPFGKH
jgi:uncharacterized protein (TIGR02246 family)